MLNGHTDINALTMRWRRDPWTPSVEGDCLYGHGIQNMKGGLTSIIMAAEAVRQSGIRLAGDLVVACVAGETQGGERHALSHGERLTDGHGGGRQSRSVRIIWLPCTPASCTWPFIRTVSPATLVASTTR